VQVQEKEEDYEEVGKWGLRHDICLGIYAVSSGQFWRVWRLWRNN